MYNLAEIRAYILKFQPVGIIVDTEVLILWLVGNYDPSLIEDCKFTNKFCKDDFELLKTVISQFKKIIITPYIIAEISNQSKQAFYGKRLSAYFHSLVKLLKSTEENNIALGSLLGMDTKVISDFGFTDMAMFEIARNGQKKIPILTNDTDFHIHARDIVPVIKFNDLKSPMVLI